MEVDTTVYYSSAIDESPVKSVLICKLSHKIYEPFETVTNHERVTEVPYPLKKVLNEHSE